MNKIKAIAVACASLALASCGNSPQNLDGFWIADVRSSDNSLAFTFNANLAQGNGNNVNVSNLSITPSEPCFASGVSVSATFSSMGSANGLQTVSFAMKVSTMSASAVNNVLTLQGTRNSDGSISGTWALTGQTSCSGDGTFRMRIPPPV
jgi:hypothetical protein